MKILLTSLLILSFNFFSKDVANCSGLQGYSYYMDYGIVPTKESGWSKDGIEDFKVKVIKDESGNFDILYSDLLGYTSSTEDGAIIIPVIETNDSLSLISSYPSKNTEIYSFWRNKSGEFKYSLAQIKNGSVSIRKNTLFVGNCSFINF
tara:strand:+ start:131 stop:577 length:447 start_codon:yes stop_codon:yes gene_type:complete